MSMRLPSADGLAGEFYAFASRGELRFQRCDGCHTWRHLPRWRCPRCRSDAFSWQRSAGRGRLFSWTVVHQAMDPAFAQDVPYVVGVIDLEEGVRMVARLHGVAAAELALDQPLAVDFEPAADGLALPVFRPRPEL